MKKILLFSLILILSTSLLASCKGMGDSTNDDTSQDEVVNDEVTNDDGNSNGDATTHVHRNGDSLIENNIDSTCENNGSFEYVVYCIDCNEELSREVVIVEKKGHTEGEPMVENSILPTCEDEGSFDLVVYCQDCGTQLSVTTKTVDSKGHEATEPVQEKYVAPGCTSSGGYESNTYCSVCHELLDSNFFELNALGHTAGTPVSENNRQPTCVIDGGYDSVVYCAVCHGELSRNWKVLSATGHLPNNSGDKCTVCNQSLVEEERLEFTLSDDGTYYIISGIGTWKSSKLVLPSEYEGLPVREVGNYAFQNCTFIETITIPASITRLGYGAAMGCVNIKNVTFSDRKGWQLMVGHDATSGTSIPALFLINPSSYSAYLYYVTDTDEYWLIKS